MAEGLLTVPVLSWTDAIFTLPKDVDGFVLSLGPGGRSMDNNNVNKLETVSVGFNITDVVRIVLYLWNLVTKKKDTQTQTFEANFRMEYTPSAPK